MKIQPINPVKFLRDEAGRSDAWIALAVNCSPRSITSWYSGATISRYFRPILMRLMKREEARMAAQIIKDAIEAKK